MKKALFGLCSLLFPIILQASAQYKCSDDEIKQFDAFLAGNRASFQNRLEELYSEEDPCSNILYVQLVDFVDSLSVNTTLKSELCSTAIDFCKNNKDPEAKRQPLHKIIEPNCMKGTSFGINRDECREYFKVEN